MSSFVKKNRKIILVKIANTFKCNNCSFINIVFGYNSLSYLSKLFN